MNPLAKIRSLNVFDGISPNEKMFRPVAKHHYFYVGRSDLLTIFNVLNSRLSYPGGDQPVGALLDFGCGHGRVTRWLRAAFPDSDIYVSDYDPTGVEYCVEHFGCNAVVTGHVPSRAYDLIWLGSVFTHLPKRIVEPLIDQLLEGLKPNGVLIFTTQGRFAVEKMRDYDWDKDERKWLHYRLNRADFEKVVQDYETNGYGYIDYPGQNNYGVCIARPNWYSNLILAQMDFIQILLQEKGSDNHQDVSAFMRADLGDTRKGPLW